jgi:hypothetical protein
MLVPHAGQLCVYVSFAMSFVGIEGAGGGGSTVAAILAFCLSCFPAHSFFGLSTDGQRRSEEYPKGCLWGFMTLRKMTERVWRFLGSRHDQGIPAFPRHMQGPATRSTRGKVRGR